VPYEFVACRAAQRREFGLELGETCAGGHVLAHFAIVMLIDRFLAVAEQSDAR